VAEQGVHLIYFPIRTVFIEGADCSGKTTLISNIHKKTKYKWHLFDRSQVSRGIFASMYDRVLPFAALHEREEINDLNNSFVFLVPEWQEVRNRFLTRGDDIHDMHSLRYVYDRFHEKSEVMTGLPNVLTVQSGAKDVICDSVLQWIEKRENHNLENISSDILEFCRQYPGGEAVCLNFSLVDDGNFNDADIEILNHEAESEYYQKILLQISNKISNEFAGKNEYDKPQTIFSRRFVYADDSCISMIHAMYRENALELNFVFRSTNVEETFPYDLKFCYYLSSEVYKIFGLVPKVNAAIMRFTLNSAHIVW